MEIVLLEEDPKNATELRVLPDKPHIDCGTVSLNTDCTVEIPPRETQFR